MNNPISNVDVVEIDVVFENGKTYLPVKPICEAIGIDPEGQRQRIMRHDIFGPVAFTIKETVADGKTYEMLCLPFEFIYLWLYTIEADVVGGSRDYVRRYKLLCVHFSDIFYRELECIRAEIKALKEAEEAILRETEAKSDRIKAEETLAKIRAERFDLFRRTRLGFIKHRKTHTR